MAKKPPKPAERMAEEVRKIPYPWLLRDDDQFKRIWTLACDAAARKIEELTKQKGK